MKEQSALPLHLRLKMFGAVLEFMRGSGVSAVAIRASFEQEFAKLSGRDEKWRGLRIGERQIGNIDVSADLLRLWHRDSRYIDRDARPRPLYIAKGKLNLVSALKSLDPSADAPSILQSMKAVGLIRRTRDGRYLPTSESAIVDEIHPLIAEHVARSVIRLVSTIYRNTDPSGMSLRLIERQAAVSDLDPADGKDFAEFTRVQGMAYLESVDDWLQQRRASRTSSPRRRKRTGVAASVHVIAYLGDELGAGSLLRYPRASPLGRLKPPPEARA